MKFALRQLLKTPGFTAVALLTLALGIGANTAIFSLVKAVLLQPLPYPDQHQLAVLWEDEIGFKGASIAWPDLVDWQRDTRAFSAIGGFRREDYTLTGQGDPEMLRGALVNAALFDAIQLPVLHGRAFTADEDKVGAPALAVLNHGFWQRRFGSDPRVIGQTLSLNGEPHTVIGVLPPEFGTPSRTDFFTQLTRHSANPGWQNRGNHPGIRAIGRIKPGFTFAQALDDLKRISERIEKESPDTSTGVRAAGELLLDNQVGSYREGLGLLLGAVGLVLLIACANLANLLLARSAARESEFAVRAALGASRARLVRQLLLESIVLALAGGALGVLLAFWARSGIVALSPAGVARFQQIAIDGRVLAVTAGLSVLTGVIFGLWPAWKTATPDLRSALQAGGRTGSGGRSATHARELLIIGEVALTLVLLVGAGLLLRSFARMHTANLGFETQGVLTARLRLPRKAYAEDEARRVFSAQLLERLRALPGVKSADLATNSPFNTGWQTSWHVPGTPAWPAGQNPLAEMNVVTDDYFRTLGIPVLRGRAFGPGDVKGARVAIVDQAFADRAFPGQDPLGKTVTLGGANEPPETIVGVVPTLKVYGYSSEPTLVQAYLPALRLAPDGFQILVRATSGDGAALATAVRRAVLDIDPNQPIWDVRTLDERVDGSFSQPRLYTYLLTIFAGLALLLAAVGLYGVLAFQVSRRTREFGIRIALGALRSQVLALVLRRGLRLLAIGIALGFVGSLALGKILGAMLYQTNALDPVVLGGVTALLLVITLFACWLPARRATRVNPIVALRTE